eukprot:TRINITY_DN10003_c0_g1_i1.p1 TRINITY_DN10003_c0_g1~~TRINITY_DN10003_c0_g1_i1.p1  ORF type:complete len:278 (-),score=62.24 TRINITY_DN10003_c0_g1_i1:478-1311(-)
MLNALAAAGDLDFFAILGDNFYDQDGRLTSAVWRQLSPEFKQSFLISTPGNHDIWVAGGPGPTADQYDQYGHGFMQWYAQDSLAASPTGLFNLSAVPTLPVNGSKLNNSPDNFLLAEQLGNVGILAYLGGGVTVAELRPRLEEMCRMMGETEGVRELLLVGHWDGASSGCLPGTDTPEIRDLIAGMAGCDQFGDRLRFLDGHTHCNQVQGKHGFMIGGHGMSGCGQVGFAVVDSFAAELQVWYFEERTAAKDDFDSILACVGQKGVSGCTELGTSWL